MQSYSIKNFNQYWQLFNELLQLLESSNKITIANEFKEARMYVNGLTEGWCQYKEQLKKTIDTKKCDLTQQENQIADSLYHSLRTPT